MGSFNHIIVNNNMKKITNKSVVYKYLTYISFNDILYSTIYH